MGDVVKQGRTVLFVSHNMDAVMSLCTHVVLVKNGTSSERLTPGEGVKQYLRFRMKARTCRWRANRGFRTSPGRPSSRT